MRQLDICVNNDISAYENSMALTRSDQGWIHTHSLSTLGLFRSPKAYSVFLIQQNSSMHYVWAIPFLPRRDTLNSALQ